MIDHITDQHNQKIHIHSSNGMYTSPYIPSYINDLACNSVTVQQTQGVGSAYIVSIPSGAKIYIDNVEQVGITTPATINNIPSTPSEHTYKLIKPGYIDSEGLLFITTGQTYNVVATIYNIPSSIWAFLIGAAIIGILLISRKEKKEHQQI